MSVLATVTLVVVPLAVGCITAAQRWCYRRRLNANPRIRIRPASDHLGEFIVTKKTKRAQQYSPEEFDQIVNLLVHDASIRADIEAITGQSLDGRSPRELFNLFRAVSGAATVQEAVARFGRARRALRRTRIELAEDAVEHIADHPDVTQIARRRIAELEAKLDELRGENRRLRASNQALARGRAASPAVAAHVIKGEVSA